MGLFAPDSARFRIVIHHMPGAVIRTQMIFHGCIGMCKCDVYKTVVSTFLTCPGKEFQVHHVINNDRELPFRSEEHTSEHQSLMRKAYAGLCLKKKQHKLIY